MEIFKLFGSILVDDKSAMDSLSKVDDKAGKTGLTLGGMIGTAAKMGAAVAAGAAVAGAGLFAMVNKTADAADEIDKLSERTGINREELQRWKYAAAQSGGDIGKLEVGIKKLSSVMDDASNGNEKAAEGFAKLGISVDDLKNKSQEDIFETVMASLGDMEQGAARNALGNDLLGKSYTELLPLLNAGSEGMNALKTRADELGLVLSEDQVKAGVVFGDTMADVKDSLGAVFTRLGAELMPTFQKFLDWVLSHMPEIQAGITTAVDAVSEGLAWLGENVLPVVVDAAKWLGENVLPIVVDAFQFLGDAVKFVMDHMNIFLPVIVGLTAAILAQAVIGTITNLMNAWKAITVTQTAVQWLLNAALNANPLGIVALAIGALIAVGVLLWKNWDTIIGWAKKLGSFVKENWDKILLFIPGIGLMVQAGKLLYENWDLIKKKAKDVWDAIVEIMRGPVNLILGMINAVIGSYEKMINGLGSAINKIPSIKIPDWVPGFGGKEFGIPDIPNLSLPRIPMLEDGGDITEGGRVLVGERAPEILDLPKGARVTPLDHSSVNQPSTIHTTINVDGRKIAEATSRPSNDRVTNNKWGSGRVVPI